MMCALNKEGEFEEDLSGNGLIPGCMCEGQFVVEEEKIYAVGCRMVKKEWRWMIGSFNGKKWSLI